jgi:hypothetical protein
MDPTSALKLAVIGLTIVLSMAHVNDRVLAGAGDVNANAAYVCVYDSVFGQPVRRALVHLSRAGSYSSETHRVRMWFAYTDSTGSALLESIPSGEYDVQLCDWSYEPRVVRIKLAQGVTDTLRVRLPRARYLHDGRQCDVIFIPEKDRQEVLERWRHGLEATDTVATVAKPERRR